MPHDACHAHKIIAHCSDDAGYMRPVAVVIHRHFVVIEEIPSTAVVNQSVAVVIYPVSAVRLPAGPDVPHEVGMVIVHSCVEYGDYNAAASGSDVPGCGCLYVSSGKPSCKLPGIVQCPLLTEHGILRNSQRLPYIIRLCEKDIGV